MQDFRYPIGKFSPQESYTSAETASCIDRIESLPARLDQSVQGLSDVQLDTPYREGGWTLRQVIHHMADSHMNAYIRAKWTLTEESPLIKAYDEKKWAGTPEANEPPAISLQLIKALHNKWVTLLRKLTKDDLQKQFIHPETNKPVTIERQIALYAWHSDHHLGHITSLKERLGWK